MTNLTPAQIVAAEYEGYLPSDSLDPAWVAGWHAAINHAVMTLTRASLANRPPAAGARRLTQQEAAEYLGVTDRTIRNYIARGFLSAQRVRGSRLIRIDVADLDALLKPVPSAKSDGGA